MRITRIEELDFNRIVSFLRGREEQRKLGRAIPTIKAIRLEFLTRLNPARIIYNGWILSKNLNTTYEDTAAFVRGYAVGKYMACPDTEISVDVEKGMIGQR